MGQHFQSINQDLNTLIIMYLIFPSFSLISIFLVLYIFTIATLGSSLDSESKLSSVESQIGI